MIESRFDSRTILASSIAAARFSNGSRSRGVTVVCKGCDDVFREFAGSTRAIRDLVELFRESVVVV